MKHRPPLREFDLIVLGCRLGAESFKSPSGDPKMQPMFRTNDAEILKAPRLLLSPIKYCWAPILHLIEPGTFILMNPWLSFVFTVHSQIICFDLGCEGISDIGVI